MKFDHELIPFPNLETIQKETGRYYVGLNKRVYPSVTTILGRDEEKKESLQGWKNFVGEENAKHIASVAASRGSYLHKIVEDYVMNKEIDYRRLMPLTVELFRKIKKNLDESLTRVTAIEACLFSNKYRFAGRTDLIGYWNGILSIIDLKTSTKVKTEEDILSYFLQCTAYAHAFHEMVDIEVPQIVVLIANQDDPPSCFVKQRKDYDSRLFEFLEKYNDGE